MHLSTQLLAIYIYLHAQFLHQSKIQAIISTLSASQSFLFILRSGIAASRQMARAAQAASLSVAVAVMAAAVMLGTVSGASYTVGEPGGSWDLRTNFTAWASTIAFHRDDQLVFKYNASAHDVVEVTQAGYSACSAASPVVAARQTGNDTVRLFGVGSRYFICGRPGHCAAGMKLEVRVTLPVCRNDSGFNICRDNVPQHGAAPPGSLASLGGSLFLVTIIVSLLLGLAIV